MQIHANNQPGLGLTPDTIRSTVWNRVGATPVVIGQVVMADMKATQSESSKTQTNPGADSFPLNNVITPTTAGIGGLIGTTPDGGFWLGVVTDLGTTGTGADNTKIGVTWRGYVNVRIETGTTGEYGKALFPANGALGVSTTAAANVRAVGRVLIDTTTTGSNAFALWDGIGGFGYTVTS